MFKSIYGTFWQNQHTHPKSKTLLELYVAHTFSRNKKYHILVCAKLDKARSIFYFSGSIEGSVRRIKIALSGCDSVISSRQENTFSLRKLVFNPIKDL